MDTSADMMLDQASTLAMDRIPRMPRAGSPKAIREAAVEFEAVFAAQMLKPMFEDLSSDGLFGGGHAEDIYRSLMVREFGKLIAQRGGFGLADAVAAELLKAQEAQSAASPTPGPDVAQAKETKQ